LKHLARRQIDSNASVQNFKTRRQEFFEGYLEQEIIEIQQLSIDRFVEYESCGCLTDWNNLVAVAMRLALNILGEEKTCFRRILPFTHVAEVCLAA